MTIDKLYAIIRERRKKMPNDSYVASLFSKGKDRVIQKVGEEATEVVIASKNEGKKRIISEIADLLFHILILMAQFRITPRDIFDELEKRS